MKTLNLEQLQEKLMGLKGAPFATILARTTPQFVGGKQCPMIQRGVRKLALVNVMIGSWSYENAVNNERLREGKPADETGAVEYFTPLERSWGKQLHNEAAKLVGIIRHEKTDKKTKVITVHYYLKTRIIKSLKYNYYDADGNHVPKAEAEKYLPKRTEGRRQQVDKPVRERDYTMQNIKTIWMEGEAYAISVD